MFSLIPVDDYYLIQNRATNGYYRPANCSDVSDESIDIVQVLNGELDACAHWDFTDRGNGYYHIVNRSTGQHIRPAACSGSVVNDEISIVQVPSNYRGNCTQWRFVGLDGDPIELVGLDPTAPGAGGGTPPGDPTPPPSPSPEPLPPEPEPTEPAPQLTIQELMLTPELNCASSGCHDATPGAAKIDLVSGTNEDIAARLVRQAAFSSGCASELLVDPDNMEESLLLKLIDITSGDQCTAKMPFGRTGVTPEVYDRFVEWVDELIQAAPPVVIAPSPEPEPPVIDSTISTLATANRAKLLLHGGVISSDDLNSITQSNGQLDTNAFRTLLEEWAQTPEFDHKLELFLTLALQQDLENAEADDLYRGQLGLNQVDGNRLIDIDKTRENLQQSFVRTAMRIVKSDGDFREVVTTRDWEVTTALLAMLSHSDQQKIPKSLRFSLFPNLRDSDYEDWRTVRLTQGSSPANYQHDTGFLNSLRAIGDGDQYALFAPRVGFFSSHVFMQNWETNGDNQFRVNTNQTVIAALGLSFEAGDTTPPNHLEGLDEEHANPGTDCYACHQHLDPMRTVFNKHFNPANLRARQTPQNTRMDFAFHGEREAIQTVDDFANALANHPTFATAWVGKLCQWANSFECDQQDAEFQALVSRFVNTNYDMKDLFIRFFSSPVFIKAVGDASEAVVSINRRDHFCDAIRVRINQVRETRGLPVVNTDYCGLNRLRNYQDLIPKDTYARGGTTFLQPNQSDIFVSRSVETFCQDLARNVAGTGANDTFSTRRLDNSLDDLTSSIMGIPEAGENYSTARTTLEQFYNVARAAQCSSTDEIELGDAPSCGLGLNERDSIRLTWQMACSSPSLNGLGL